MVFEFTELQGVMGREYAKVGGENDAVAQAIFEHYLPRFAGDILPKTNAGIALSIADKLDSIAGFFAIGIQPTGSQDPYALRRQALGVLNILMDSKLDISLKELVELALNNYSNLEFNKEEVVNSIMEFFKERIKNLFRDLGIRYDVIDAVLSSEINDISDMHLRATELNNWLDKDELVEMLTAFNRVSTLAQKAVSSDVNEQLLTEDAEINLYKEFNNIKVKVKELLNDKHNIIEGTVISAIALTEKQVKELEEKLSKKYNKNVTLENEVDQSILGGVLVRLGNTQIDGSVKTRLNNIKAQLPQVIS